MTAHMNDQARHYHQHVAEASEYLLGRGVTGIMAQRALLGYVKDPLPGHDRYVGRIVIPYMTANGVVDLRFRALGEMTPKYLSLPGHKPRLYNTLVMADDPDTIGITEGEFDSLIITHHIGVPAVAVPGAQSWDSARHGRIFKGFSRVLVFADGDQPGRDLANQIARDVPQAVIVDLGDGLDVTDAYLASGVDTIKKKAGMLHVA